MAGADRSLERCNHPGVEPWIVLAVYTSLEFSKVSLIYIYLSIDIEEAS